MLYSGAVSAEVITSLSADPNPFSPNGDGILDRTTISCLIASPVDSLRVSVRDASLAQVWWVWTDSLEAGLHSWVWAGTTSTGLTFSDAVHSLSAVAYVGGAVADSAARRVATDRIAPSIRDFQQVFPSFAPDGLLWSVTKLEFWIEAGGPASDTTLVRILDAQGSPVVFLGGFGGAVADTSFSWSGLDEDSALVEEGAYFFEVASADEAGNGDVESGVVYLDLAAPTVAAVDDTVVITDADTLLLTAFPDTLAGWAVDPSGVAEVQVRWEGGAWESLADLVPVTEDSLLWTAPFGEAADVDGWYDLSVKAVDIFGHASDPVDVVIGKASLEPVLVGSEITSGDGVFANGDTIVILTAWDRDGYTVTANFISIDSKYKKNAEDVTPLGDGTYEISYTVSGSNIRQNEDSLAIPITATYVWRTATDTVWVELRNEGPPQEEAGTLTLDQNVFAPNLGEVLTIRFPEGGPGARVEIYTLMGERVWSERVDGLTSVLWAGANSEGDEVASGVYLVRLGGHVRKVGVVK